MVNRYFRSIYCTDQSQQRTFTADTPKLECITVLGKRMNANAVSGRRRHYASLDFTTSQTNRHAFGVFVWNSGKSHYQEVPRMDGLPTSFHRMLGKSSTYLGHLVKTNRSAFLTSWLKTTVVHTLRREYQNPELRNNFWQNPFYNHWLPQTVSSTQRNGMDD